MDKVTLSSFREKPKNTTTWRGMWLGLSTVLVPVFLGIFTSVIRPLVDPASMEGRESGLGIQIGLGAVLLSLLLAFFALKISIKAYREGERSWVMWVGLVFATLTSLNWILMIIGEFLFPH